MTVLSELYMQLTGIEAGLLRDIEYGQKQMGRRFYIGHGHHMRWLLFEEAEPQFYMS
jgi:hypothetical protein